MVANLPLTGTAYYAIFLTSLTTFLFLLLNGETINKDTMILTYHINLKLELYQTCIIYWVVSGALFLLGESMGWGI